MNNTRLLHTTLLYLALLAPSTAAIVQSILLSRGDSCSIAILIILSLIGSLVSANLLLFVIGRMTASEEGNKSTLMRYHPINRLLGLFAVVTITMMAFRALSRFFAGEALHFSEQLFVFATTILSGLVFFLVCRLYEINRKSYSWTGLFLILLVVLAAGKNYLVDLLLRLNISAFMGYMLFQLLLLLPVLLVISRILQVSVRNASDQAGSEKKPILIRFASVLLAVAGAASLLLFIPKQVSAQSLLYEEINNCIFDAKKLLDAGKPYAAYIKAKDAVALSGVLDAYTGAISQFQQTKKADEETAFDVQAAIAAIQNAVPTGQSQEIALFYQGLLYQAVDQEKEIQSEFEDAFYATKLPKNLRMAAGLALLQLDENRDISRYLVFHQELMLIEAKASMKNDALSGQEKSIRKLALNGLERAGVQQVMSLFEFRLFDQLLTEAGYLFSYFPSNETLNQYIVLSDLERPKGEVNYSQALAAMQRLMENDPENIEILEFCMSAYERMGNFQNAYLLAAAFYDANPNSSNAKDLYSYSIARKNAGAPFGDEDKLALKLAEEALSFSDRPWYSHYTLATLYLKKDDFTHALDAIGTYYNLAQSDDELVESMPNDLFSFAETYASKLSNTNAYQAILEFIPHWHALPDLIMGMDARNKGQFAQAEAFFQAAIDNGLEFPRVYLQIGFAYQDHWLLEGAIENYLMAEKCFGEAALRAPANPSTWFALASLYEHGNEPKKAINSYERVKLLSGQAGQDSLHLYQHANQQIDIIKTQMGGGQ